uniref:Uncharacterized protein n=1 Tax=Scophthalmus maximus TaxID=52904 RepID=A0A8D3CFC9_SCOMX
MKVKALQAGEKRKPREERMSFVMWGRQCNKNLQNLDTFSSTSYFS